MRFFLIAVIFWMFQKYITEKDSSYLIRILPAVLLATNILYTVFLVSLRKRFVQSKTILKIFHYVSLVFCPIAFSLIIRFTGNEYSVFTLFYYFYLVVIPLAQISFSFYETVLSEAFIIAAYPGFLFLFRPPQDVERVIWQVAFEILIALTMLVFALIIKSENRELETLTEKLQNLAITDSLTGVFNRRYFQEILSKEIAKALRNRTPLSIAIGDLDNFKTINDTYGHLEGDKALKMVVETIKNNIRSSDIVARFGGEEFIILFPGTDKEEACRITERVREAIAGESEKIYREPLTISFGISTYPEDGTTQEELIKRADRALYEAKRLGKNRVIICKGMIG
jgi:diguanylate cyclase (GGDEF)-like protein